LDDPELLQELLNGVAPQSQKSARRENCSQALMFMAETWPEVLLPKWDYFIQLCKSNNGSSKYVAVYVIASLTKADQTGKFDQFFEDYFSLLNDESVMVASHAALNAAKIGKACPALQTKIAQRLMQIDQSQHEGNRLALVKAYIIDTLDALYETSSIQPEIMDFVRNQVQSDSPKTIKLAKAFIKKWG
jgi:hypothetical protein